ERALSHIRESPELATLLAEQKRAVQLTAAVDVRAPTALRDEVEAMLAPPRDRPARGRQALNRPRLGLAMGALATAAAVVAVTIGLSGGASSKLNVQQAAALALRPATLPAPAESRAHRTQLAASMEGVPFPYWEERFGLRSTGARGDRLAGRSVTTVFYANRQGQRIGYAIVSGRAPITSGGTTVRRWGVSYRVLAHNGATVVTWRREGHLCVVAGRGVSARTLLSLASWGSAKRQTT
ncbi:MAG TPA: hypothetical protein VIG42_03205, partial [Solirubrobacteraceae bacterium]